MGTVHNADDSLLSGMVSPLTWDSEYRLWSSICTYSTSFGLMVRTGIVLAVFFREAPTPECVEKYK